MEESRAPSDVAEMLGVSQSKVRTWIKTGELRAVNVAARESLLPHYRIMHDDLRRFIESRTTGGTDEPQHNSATKATD